MDLLPSVIIDKGPGWSVGKVRTIYRGLFVFDVLVHELGQALGSIGYSASYDGAPLNLSNGPVVVSRAYEGMSTQMDTLKITIAPQTDKYAGKYRDTITLEFIPY